MAKNEYEDLETTIRQMRGAGVKAVGIKLLTETKAETVPLNNAMVNGTRLTVLLRITASKEGEHYLFQDMAINAIATTEEDFKALLEDIEKIRDTTTKKIQEGIPGVNVFRGQILP